MVSNIFCFHSYLGNVSILTHIFQMGWFNHQPVHGWKSPVNHPFINGWNLGVLIDQYQQDIPVGVSKNRGVSPKMDGEKNGKPYSNG